MENVFEKTAQIVFNRLAKGSTAEVHTQSIISKEIGYINVSTYNQINEEYLAISEMLTSLIQARKNSSLNRKP